MNPSKARTLCMGHYNYHYARKTLPDRVNLLSAIDRFNQWCDRSDPNGCWPWTGALSSGYGVLQGDDGAGAYVHRWSFEHFVGPVPDGMIVGHVCHDLDLACRGGECVHRRCAQPCHLKPMTIGDNNRAGRGAMLTRERGGQKTECPQKHPLSGDNLYVRPTDGARVCRTCTRTAKVRYRAKQAAA